MPGCGMIAVYLSAAFLIMYMPELLGPEVTLLTGVASLAVSLVTHAARRAAAAASVVPQPCREAASGEQVASASLWVGLILCARFLFFEALSGHPVAIVVLFGAPTPLSFTFLLRLGP